MEIRETGPSTLSSRTSCFPTWPTFMAPPSLNLDLPVISMLQPDWFKTRTLSWIWRTIAFIGLWTTAYCLSRLLIGYRLYESCILLTPCNHILFTEFSFVHIKGRKCIQFTDNRDGTKYALKVVNEINIAFKVSWIVINGNSTTILKRTWSWSTDRPALANSLNCNL